MDERPRPCSIFPSVACYRFELLYVPIARVTCSPCQEVDSRQEFRPSCAVPGAVPVATADTFSRRSSETKTSTIQKSLRSAGYTRSTFDRATTSTTPIAPCRDPKWWLCKLRTFRVNEHRARRLSLGRTGHSPAATIAANPPSAADTRRHEEGASFKTYTGSPGCPFVGAPAARHRRV